MKCLPAAHSHTPAKRQASRPVASGFELNVSCAQLTAAFQTLPALAADAVSMLPWGQHMMAVLVDSNTLTASYHYRVALWRLATLSLLACAEVFCAHVNCDCAGTAALPTIEMAAC